MRNKELEHSVINFLSANQIAYHMLGEEPLRQLNNYLKNLWQGSTDKINWQKFSTNHKSIDFGEVITSKSVKQLLTDSNFRLLSNDFLVLYYSGSNAPILVDATLLRNYLFDFMEEVAFLNTMIFFEYNFSNNQFATNKINASNFIEVRIFENITGQI